MPVKNDHEEKTTEKPKAIAKKPPAWVPKEHDIVNSGTIGKQAYKVGETITPRNQRQEAELRRRKLIK